MAVSPAFLQFILDQLQPLGPLGTRRMFGCVGIFSEGVMFALLDGDDAFYAKVDEQSLPHFQSAGCRPLVYLSRGRAVTLSYQAVPDSALDDREELLAWARQGMAAAARGVARSALKDSAMPTRRRRRKPVVGGA